MKDTVHEVQGREYLCGAASIKMILSHWTLSQPPTQGDIWAKIQAHTVATQPRPTPCDRNLDEGCFDGQQCDLCSGTSYSCWYTTPEALAATVNAYAPPSAPTAAAEYHRDPNNAIKRIADSLSGASTDKMPAAFTKASGLHWSVAIGYQLDGPISSPAQGVAWSGGTITGIYIRDPNEIDPWDALHLATPASLRKPVAGYLEAITCGPHTNDCPIVVKSEEKYSESTFFRIIATSWVYQKVFDPSIFRRWLPKKKVRRTPPPPPPL